MVVVGVILVVRVSRITVVEVSVPSDGKATRSHKQLCPLSILPLTKVTVGQHFLMRINNAANHRNHSEIIKFTPILLSPLLI